MEKTKSITQKDQKLTLIPSPLKAQQLLTILQKTPPSHVYRRPAKGGGEWEYVTGTYVKKVLNYVFGWLWDFEIKEHGREKSEDGELIWVLGKLTIKDKSGNPLIVKEQFGRADVKYKKGTKTPVDIGNDLKAAATDALKKCASELGIASDIYGKNEFREIQKIDKGFIPPEEDIQEVKEVRVESASKPRVEELKRMLKGETDAEKLEDLKKRTGIQLRSFSITEKHAGILVASLLNKEVKN